MNEKDLIIDFYNNAHKSVFIDLVNDDFDTTWCLDTTWFNGNSDKLIEIKDKEYSRIPIESILEKNINDNSVTYKYNNEFFRSDNFIAQHDGKHILFAGCSETEGIGGNINDAWANILYNKISKNEKCSGFFNLGRSGFGWQKIINNSLIYFKKYGAPDVMFILLPNAGRGYYWSEIDKRFKYWQKYPKNSIKDNIEHNNNNIEIFQTQAEYFHSFVNFITAWKYFNFICKQLNIKLYFGTWFLEDAINIENTKIFNNYINDICNFDKYTEYTKNMIKNKTFDINDKFLFTKRDGHAGLSRHSYWADCFYNSYINLFNSDSSV